jgi:hypothetical protein
MTHRRTFLAVVVACACALAGPAAAPAATVAVTGDDGAPVPLAGAVTVRTMTPQVLVTFEPEDQRYEVVVEGPDGRVAGGGAGCRPRSAWAPVPVAYAGNGVYTVRVRVSGDPDDSACTSAGTPVVGTFTVAAWASVGLPASPLLTRRAFKRKPLRHPVQVDVNPGATAVELRYARELPPSPDGSLGADAETVPVDPGSGRALVGFERPGTYTFVARAVLGRTPSPWSPPATVRVLSPFDFNGEPPFSDARGPRYRIAGVLRETTASGRIAVAIRRGGAGRWRRLGAVRIRPGGRFAVRFTLRGSGRYQLRYRFAGSPTTAPGEVRQGFRIARTSR